MIIITEKTTEDDIRFTTYGVKGKNDFYPYDYPDISPNRQDAEILDRILSSGAVPKEKLSKFIVFYIDFSTQN